MSGEAGDLRGRLRALDTCAVSDALDFLGITGATTGIRSMCPGRGRSPAAPAPWRRSTPRPRRRAVTSATQTVASSGPGDVIVIANRGRVNVSSWGDILTAAAQVQRHRGRGDRRRLPRRWTPWPRRVSPLWARAAVPVTARGRLAERGSDVPVLFDGVLVTPGDLVLADGSPASSSCRPTAPTEIIDTAERLAARQDAMRDAVRAGQPVTEVMHDDRFRAALSGDE